MIAEGLRGLPAGAHRLLPSEQAVDLRHRLGRFHPWEEGFDRSPPACGAGESIGPPDFVGIAASASGAAWWFRLIADHPGVHTRGDIPTERHFLSHFATTAFADQQVAQYHGWFPRRPGTITGEWTPSYAALPWVPDLLARAAPEARLLMMLRNPIERFRLGLVQTSAGRSAQVGTHVAEAAARGYYGDQLCRVLERFPSEQVLVLQYERCVADPAGELERTHRFLRLDPLRGTARTGRTRRGVPGPRGALDSDALGRIVEMYADDVAVLASLVPSLDLSLWPEFACG